MKLLNRPRSTATGTIAVLGALLASMALAGCGGTACGES